MGKNSLHLWYVSFVVARLEVCSARIINFNFLHSCLDIYLLLNCWTVVDGMFYCHGKKIFSLVIRLIYFCKVGISCNECDCGILLLWLWPLIWKVFARVVYSLERMLDMVRSFWWLIVRKDRMLLAWYDHKFSSMYLSLYWYQERYPSVGQRNYFFLKFLKTMAPDVSCNWKKQLTASGAGNCFSGPHGTVALSSDSGHD